ncbi:hypothetical protein SADUNF_Sadunf09G0078700 [Salix dunnii]|uniref:Uncharacterized protein n=1 Tax=Salix dunnii TaxID=1413687 RepID=A0A835JVZ6_9ROSI|nr:hypothetical protein SADUNF_Sadunf09G0078700 [Salix dunnii]
MKNQPSSCSTVLQSPMTPFTKLLFVSSLLLMLVAVSEASLSGMVSAPNYARCMIKRYRHCYNLEQTCPSFYHNLMAMMTKPSPPEQNDHDESEGSKKNPSPPEESKKNSSPLEQSNHGESEGSNEKPAPPKQSGHDESEGFKKQPSPPEESNENSSPPEHSSHYEAEGSNKKQLGVKASTNPDVTTLSMCVPVHALVDVKLIVSLASLFACYRPGAECQDPRFVGDDGITFYFHGKKDHNFCLVSDPNLHINAHFIGKRNENLTRDFTWVQSIAIFFDKHQLFLGALKASTWDDSADLLSLALDGEPLNFPANEGSKWQSTSMPSVSVTRISDRNNAVVEVEGLLKITAKVVPITEEDSRVHNYGITKDDCYAHLDLGFKFYSLSNEVNGVLGQTYRPGYASRVNVVAKMAAIWGLELPGMRCAGGIDGKGVV